MRCSIPSAVVVMISHIHHLIDHDEAKTLVEEFRHGAEERLIPILMTALEAGQPGCEIQVPMTVVIRCGLISSTVLKLVVVPAHGLRFGGVLWKLGMSFVVVLPIFNNERKCHASEVCNDLWNLVGIERVRLDGRTPNYTAWNENNRISYPRGC